MTDAIAGFLDPSLPLWDPEADDTLVVRQVREETHDVKTFVLAPKAPCRFAYKPGQFLTLDLDIAGERVNRCYTISSAPTRPGTISITVKRVPDGPVSNFLHDTLKAGSEIRAVGPMGEFTCVDHPAPKYLFLSGGSGITPLMSMARSFHDLAEQRDIVFVHAARSPADIIFRDELALMARNLPDFRFAAVCEGDTIAERWNGFSGRLTLDMLKLIAPDFMEREIFVCGPSPFMMAVRMMLGEAGFDMVRHHEESFNFEELSAAEPEVAAEVTAAEDTGVKTFRVEFAKSKKVIEVPEDAFVLEMARKAGMRLPASCTKGMCGTCKSKLVSGEVEMKHAGGIRQREIDQGMVLICCSRPKTDLVIDK
ncbi:3-ketosteroid-9-alpha-hydroxylase reductase subunit [Hartmannibacter diazotrophicus]|uniref:3-ketosteroid-9-alpha-hydroxylase reductase subunit n=1 Tax=Hartmannibacter diazotrophicus TaxID=1482074 RepID=A0A2C9D057_9HYPH|nr:hybrid-cluster NAD(P)-dependent oxidoreductase [Hartmannibacter diazotrophicus]SON53613.1 3-ketosteroid-9-alpha-hydroxylase reductase subunit [Hartmannibacter diazotrophicus]